MKNKFPKTENVSSKRIFGNCHFTGKSAKTVDMTAFFDAFPNTSQIPKNTVFQLLYVIGQATIGFFEALKFEFCFSGNANKITVLLTKMQELQGFLRKKDPARFLLQGQFFYYGFTNWVCPKLTNF